jgi:hypothetical protein
MPDESCSGNAQIKAVVVDYLRGRRDALCRELASVERQLASLGVPVRNPKIQSKQQEASTTKDT